MKDLKEREQLKEQYLENLFDMIRTVWDHNGHHNSFDPHNPSIPLHQVTYGPEEIMAFMECMLDNRVTMGPVVQGFERLYCEAFDAPYGVTSNSGSSANLLAIAALSNPATPKHLKPGDEVIVPALSWSTTIWPLVQHQLVPVFVDVDPVTLNIDPNKIEAAITSKTKAAMIVPVYGNPCDMDAITSICKKHDLWLIEDSCESMGAEYDGKHIGTFGDMGTFSFYYSHHITTLEGGITLTPHADLDDLMRILRAHGWVRQTKNPSQYTNQYPSFDPKFLFVNQGYNLRMTDPQAAMGFHQLPKLSHFIDLRAKSAAYFHEHMTPYQDWISWQRTTPKGKNAWFGLCLQLSQNAPFSTQDCREFLESRGIETRPIICGNITRQPAMNLYPHRINGNLSVSDKIMSHGFAIANHQGVCEKASQHIVESFREFFNRYAKAA